MSTTGAASAPVTMLRKLAPVLVLFLALISALLVTATPFRVTRAASESTVMLPTLRKSGVLLVMVTLASPGASSSPVPLSTSPFTLMLPSFTVISGTVT